MNRNVVLSAGAAAVLVVGAVTVATSAAAAGGSHTLVLTGKTLQTTSLGKSNSVEADVLTKAGKRVGYETESCNFGGTNDKCAVTITVKGGVLLGHITFPITNGTSPTATGKITGGLGAYTGSKGTIKVVSTANHGTITVKYH
jgi:hypothetical protein